MKLAHPTYYIFVWGLLFWLGLGLAQAQESKLLERRLPFTLPSQSIESALQEIEQRTDIRFSYNPQDFSSGHRVSLPRAEQTLGSTLDRWLQGRSLGYKAIGGQVVIYTIQGSDNAGNSPFNKPNFNRLSGYVVDETSGERLPYAKVWDARSGRGAVANAYGFFSLSLPPDSVTLLASFPNYVGRSRNFRLDQSQQIELALKPYLKMEEIEIEADLSSTGPDEADMSTLVLPVSEVQNMPALLGEADAIRAIQLMPGVSGGSEGTTGIYVRGGSPDQNLVLLDGVPLYYVNHWGGFASVFNSDALSDVRLTKGGFPARFGGRLSSVMEVSMKEGNRRETEVAGSIGLLSVKGSIQGPIGKKPGQEEANTSYIISARRNYLDLINRGINLINRNQDTEESPLSYGFYDLNAKINHIFSEKDRLYLSAYWGQDRSRIVQERSWWIDSDGSQIERRPGQAPPNDSVFGLSRREESRVQWGNGLVALRWNHVWGHRAFSNLTASYSRYYYENDQNGEIRRQAPGEAEETTLSRQAFRSGIADATLRWEADFYPNHQHQVKWGAQATHHSYRPGILQERQILGGETLRDTAVGDFRSQGLEAFAFVEHDWRLGERFRVHSGLHASMFRFGEKNYFSLQPRVSARASLSENLAFKASYARMTQFVHLLVNQSVGMPVDLWVPATDRVPPQQADQVAAGFSWQSPNGQWEASLEGYYKLMTDLIDYREGYSYFTGTITGWESAVETGGRGEAYGSEWFLRKRKGRLRGWVGYTLAWNWRQFDEINNGERYAFRYDRRHDASIVAIYSLKPGIEVSGTWVFSTGSPITIATGRHESFYQDRNALPDPNPRGNDIDGDIYLYEGGRNNFSMRNYHRLDLSISFTKEKSW
ncbi:MAG: carboxypeptidase-like regulatory domain-containing protein, partial [Bacteroidota bacterium]